MPLLLPPLPLTIIIFFLLSLLSFPPVDAGQSRPCHLASSPCRAFVICIFFLSDDPSHILCRSLSQCTLFVPISMQSGCIFLRLPFD